MHLKRGNGTCHAAFGPKAASLGGERAQMVRKGCILQVSVPSLAQSISPTITKYSLSKEEILNKVQIAQGLLCCTAQHSTAWNLL